MRFGVNVINFGAMATPDTLCRWLTFTEEEGFHFAMVSDHAALTRSVRAAYPAPFYDPFIMLSFASGMTRRIELGTTVLIVAYRHPLLAARMIANIDQLSAGRMIVGVGVGWAADEFEALGLNFDERGQIADEYLGAMIDAWTSTRTSLRGKFATYTDVATGPSPRRRPHPPIWVGGASFPAMRRAVLFGDAWHPDDIRPGWLRSQGLPALRAVAERLAREPPPIAPRLVLRITHRVVPDDDRLAGEGTIEQIREDLLDLEDLGVDYVLFDTNRDRSTFDDHLRTLTQAVDNLLDVGTGSVRC